MRFRLVVTCVSAFVAAMLSASHAGAQEFCFNAAVNYAAGDGPQSVFAADLDGDGDQDLAVANFYHNTVSVLKNNGDGTFAAAVNYTTGYHPISVFAADLDGDNDADLAVANQWGIVAVLKNNGDGTFAAAVNYWTGDSPISVFAADLDGDNDADLAVANEESNTVSVLKNNGDGTFAAAVNYAARYGPASVFAADLDGDNDADLVVATRNSNTVSVLKNNGDGTFAAAVNYAAGGYPRSVFAADLDGDGDADLAVANWWGNVSVLKNNGDGTFAAVVNYAAGNEPYSVFAVDLDGDNDADLAVANYSSDNVSVLTNNGDGTFAAAVNYAAGDGPYSVFAADLDGDNDADLAVANYLSDKVSVLINCGFGLICSLPSDTTIYLCEPRLDSILISVPGTECTLVGGPGTLRNGWWIYEPPGDTSVDVAVRCASPSGSCEDTIAVRYSIDPGLLCDDFEDGVISGWQQLRGLQKSAGPCWTESDHTLSASNLAGQWQWCALSNTTQLLENYFYETWLKGTLGVDKVVLFRVQDADNFCAVNLRSDWNGRDEVAFDKMVGGDYQADIAKVDYPSQSGTWYKVGVVCENNNYKVFVDDQQVLQFTDANNPFSGGKIGLACWTGEKGLAAVSFDHVKLEDTRRVEIQRELPFMAGDDWWCS